MAGLHSWLPVLRCKPESPLLHKHGLLIHCCNAITDYIHSYNRERYQRMLGCMAPMEFLAAGGK
ncbi:IS3 family transposase [uncultured Oscillibacter sp.]|uniref:IS3 family transposase n=1 Tax=uncultured Oscillibacter sp. TaxID=876091 RepID=UPI0025F1FB88|nr:IS3 family transposase [uncultured Oscillibacter sp.]